MAVAHLAAPADAQPVPLGVMLGLRCLVGCRRSGGAESDGKRNVTVYVHPICSLCGRPISSTVAYFYSVNWR